MTSTSVDLRKPVPLSPLLRLLILTQLAFNVGSSPCCGVL
ncbi:hypothetical protein SCANM124S_02282 [Streptomyces canus]